MVPSVLDAGNDSLVLNKPDNQPVLADSKSERRRQTAAFLSAKLAVP